jgi:hypothetical protein
MQKKKHMLISLFSLTAIGFGSLSILLFANEEPREKDNHE